MRPGDVARLPQRALDGSELAELKRSLAAAPLTRRELVDLPVEEVAGLGPWVAPPGSALADDLERVAAIVRGLIGPGRVPLVEGAQLAIDLLTRVIDGADG